MALTGMSDFDKNDSATIGGLTTGTNDFRAKVEGGVIVQATNGVSGRAALSYDGIGGDGFSAWGGQLLLRIAYDR